MKKSISVAAASVFILTAPALADQNGNPDYTNYKCSDNALSAMTKVCSAVASVFPGVSCPQTTSTCVIGKQEIFAGLTGETASPTNIKAWNGMGVGGKLMQTAGLCMMRDLSYAPMSSKATASLPIGTISARNTVGYRSYDYNAGEFKGYQRLTLEAPVIGDVDLVTQDFALRGVSTNLKGQGKLVGSYAVDATHALELEAQGGAESFGFEIDAITITTPYGTVSPKPHLTLGRLSSWSLSPYGGAAASLINPGNFRTRDVYGRLSGQAVASSLKVLDNVPSPPSGTQCIVNFGGSCVAIAPAGWMSQAALGSRDVRADVPSWKAPAGVFYPLRPDADPTKARGDYEKTPNAYARAGVKIEYDPTGIIPAEVLSSTPVTVKAKVFVDPNVQVAAGGATNVNMLQAASINPALTKPGTAPGTPVDVESLSRFGSNSSASVFGRFALDAGVDITLRVYIPLPWPFDDIDITVLDVHPRTAFLEKTTGDAQAAPQSAFAIVSAQDAVKTGNLFQAFTTFSGPKNGVAALQACAAQPAPPAQDPPPPGYKKGDPGDLVKVIDMPCNICIGMPDTPWTSKNKQTGEIKTGVAKGFAFKYQPADDSGLPQSQKWVCGGGPPPKANVLATPSGQSKVNNILNAGCYDQCRVNQSTGKFEIVESAKSLFAKGVLKDVPNGCY